MAWSERKRTRERETGRVRGKASVGREGAKDGVQKTGENKEPPIFR
jgi:hypothetical protein